MGRKKRQRRDHHDYKQDGDGAILGSIPTVAGGTGTGKAVSVAESIANVLSSFDANDNCYNQVIHRFGQRDSGSKGDGDGDGDGDDYVVQHPPESESDPPLHWLNTIYTLSRSTTTTTTSFATSSSSGSNSNSDSGTIHKDEIQTLTNELNSIKHLLWPTAIKTSQIKNRISRRKKKKPSQDCIRNTSKNEDEQGHEYGNSADDATESTPTLPINFHSKAKPASTSKSKSTSPSMEFRLAREKCNPFENLGNQKWLNGKTKSFVCRSAMKLANMDAILNFVLTGGLGDGSTSTSTSTTCGSRDANGGANRGDTGVDSGDSTSTTKKKVNVRKTANNCDSPTSSTNNEQSMNTCTRSYTMSYKSFKFVDLCGAPGGFSEYILRRFGTNTFGSLVADNENDDDNNNKRDSSSSSSSTRTSICSCYGYGMSLIGTNDDGCGAKWDLKTLSQITDMHESENGNENDDGTSVSSFSGGKTKKSLMWKVCNGDDGTGDIYNFQNVIKLQNDIQHDHKQRRGIGKGDDSSSTSKNDDWKVDLVVADGGFDAQRDSECQESLAHELVICQTAAALSLLKKGGQFVIKMFGFQKARKLILYHLYDTFEKLIFLKPVTSRPASAERYVVCLNYDGLDPSFDLLSWRDGVVNAAKGNGTSDIVNTRSDIDNALDLVDRSMLQLNFQACAEIIWVLREEELQAKSNTDSAKDEQQPKPIDFSFYHEHFLFG